jgi:hypothetical protein
MTCGTPLKQTAKLSNPERIAFWKLWFRAPMKTTWSQLHFTRNRHRATVWKRMLEERGYETRPIMPVFEHSSNPQQLITLPISWNTVTAWIEAEGSFYTKANRRLYTRIDIVQKNRITGGYQLLNQIKTFVDNQLKTHGTIYEYPDRPPYLRWHTHTDCYKIIAKILPHMHHPAKIKEATKMLATIEAWIRNEIARMEAQIPLLTGKALGATLRNLAKIKRDLEEIQKIKEEYPYIKALY